MEIFWPFCHRSATQSQAKSKNPSVYVQHNGSRQIWAEVIKYQHLIMFHSSGFLHPVTSKQCFAKWIIAWYKKWLDSSSDQALESPTWPHCWRAVTSCVVDQKCYSTVKYYFKWSGLSNAVRGWYIVLCNPCFNAGVFESSEREFKQQPSCWPLGPRSGRPLSQSEGSVCWWPGTATTNHEKEMSH